jgi:hypothetical protein
MRSNPMHILCGKSISNYKYPYESLRELRDGIIPQVACTLYGASLSHVAD